MANRYHLEIARGEDVTFSMVARTRAMEVVDLTDGSVTVRIALAPGRSALLTKTATVTDATNGAFTWTLTDVNTLALEEGDHFVSALFTASDDSVQRVAEGRLRILERVEP